MKKVFATAILISIFGIVTIALGQVEEIKQAELDAIERAKIKLPESKTASVFTVNFSGGFRMQLPKGWVKKPYLQVFADGRVVNGAAAPQAKAHEFQLTPEQLQSLLKQIIEEQKFYEIDTEKMAKEMKAANAPRIADGGTVEITLDLPRGSHSVKVHGARFAAKALPEVKDLQRVAKVEDIGRKLVLTAVAGGYEKVERALSAVNEQLEERGLDLMTLNELYTCKQKDDILTINFNRRYYLKNGRWRDWINAKFTIDGDEEKVEIKTNLQ